MNETEAAAGEAIDLLSFRSMSEAFDQARRRSSVLEYGLQLARYSTRLLLAGRAVADLVEPALGHLFSFGAAASPRLTMQLFTAPPPASHSSPAAALDSGQAGRVRTSADGRFLSYRVPGADYMLDRRTRTLVGSVGSPADVPRSELAKPMAIPLTVWLADEGLDVVHAGLVSRGGRGLLFAGHNGAGKSTCTLACALRDFDFLGDDCIALDLDDPAGVAGYSMYASGTLEEEHIHRVAPGRPIDALHPTPGKGKLFFTLKEAHHLRIGRVASIHALVLPRLTESPRSALRPATKAEALRTIAPSSILKRAVPRERTWARLALLASRIPAYWLDMSRNPSDIPETVIPLLGGDSNR